MLLKLCKLILTSVHLSGLHDGFGFANFITEKKITAICCATHKNELYTGIFKFWIFTFWNLSPEIKRRLALNKVFFYPDFLAFRSVLFLQQTSL